MTEDPNTGPLASARLLAGAPGVDRRRFPKPGADPRWYQPDHIRDPARVRSEMATQIAAGADIVLAPTFLTHRRALLPIGESRRSREWTEAAVRLAREAVEVGLGMREEAADGPPSAPVTVLGVLPDPDMDAEAGSGRLAPRDAATERDEADQAAILADAAVDGILVEPRPSLARALAAATVATQTGLPTWTMAQVDEAGRLPWGDPVEAWAEAVSELRPELLLLCGSSGPANDALRELVTRAAGATPFGVLLTAGSPEGAARAWLESGATVLGIADDATLASLQPLRAALDTYATELRHERQTQDAAWTAWVEDAALRAPGGRAVWLGPKPASLPSGFEWVTVEPGAASGMPAASFRLVVAPGGVPAAQAARLLELGGYLAATLSEDDGTAIARLDGLRLLERHDRTGAPPGTWIIARRED